MTTGPHLIVQVVKDALTAARLEVAFMDWDYIPSGQKQRRADQEAEKQAARDAIVLKKLEAASDFHTDPWVRGGVAMILASDGGPEESAEAFISKATACDLVEEAHIRANFNKQQGGYIVDRMTRRKFNPHESAPVLNGIELVL